MNAHPYPPPCSQSVILGRGYFFRTAAGSDKQAIANGCINDAQNRSAILDQANIHREITVAQQEFAGSIQRIDQ